jgi:hypothetical protein
LSGKYIPVRRSKDYVDFKIKSPTAEDNFLDKNKLVFNSYKTAKTYGQQVLTIPIKVKNILKKWIDINPTEWLLFDTNMGKMSNVKLTQRINKIFNDKKVSVNQLRHTSITDKLEDHQLSKKKAEKLMSDMGSSLNMVDTYYKE